MDDVNVQVNGYYAPLLYISPGQINAQMPAELTGGPAQIVVSVAGSASVAFNISIQDSAPGIFTSGGTAAAINLNGTVNSPAHPVPAGSAISVYLTGSGALEANVADGAPALSGSLASASTSVTATLGEQLCNVLYAGPAPGYAGLIQINLAVPPLATGSYPLTITVDGETSNSAMIYVQGQ
jgi:uncharacterized protein (TIGR03437 family)